MRTFRIMFAMLLTVLFGASVHGERSAVSDAHWIVFSSAARDFAASSNAMDARYRSMDASVGRSLVSTPFVRMAILFR